jgi:hypothetical protein
MKRGLSTLVLVVLALALGAYIYFVESKRKPASERSEEKGKAFVGLDSAAVEELEVKASSGDLTKVKKDGGRWKVVAPITGDADDTEVSAITSNLASLEVQRVVAENATDLGQFGLAPAKTEISFRTAGDQAPRTLLLGDKTATGGDMYAKTGSDARVFLVSGFLDSTFNRGTFDLRDKAVLKFERDGVTGLEIESPTRRLVFAKDGDTWKMTAPLAVRADTGTVEGLLGRIHTGRMKTLVADTPADLAPYGLDTPSSTITFVAGSARSAIALGAKTPDGQVYARDLSRPIVFTVEAFLAEDAAKTVDDFRPKDLYEFRTFTGMRFEITRAATTTVFEKKKGADANAPDAWAQTSPAPAKAPETSTIEDFLAKVSNLRAQSFVEALPAGTTEVARTVARWNEGKKEETVVFHKAGADLFATRAGDPGAARLTASDFDDVIKALEAIK